MTKTNSWTLKSMSLAALDGDEFNLLIAEFTDGELDRKVSQYVPRVCTPAELANRLQSMASLIRNELT